MTKRTSLFGAVLLAFLGAGISSQVTWATAWAADAELHVRVVQMKATGERAEGKKSELDAELEPFRTHLEQAKLDHAQYRLLGNKIEKGAFGKPLAFAIEGGLRATVTVTQVEDRYAVVLEVARLDRKTKASELVSRTTLKMKDGATTVQEFSGAVAGGDLVLAVTPQRAAF